MAAELVITFPEGAGMEARYKDRVVRLSGAPEWYEGPPPSPFDLFIISLGTCSAANMLAFMVNRDLPTDQARFVLRRETDREKKMISRITFEVTLPPGFPEKYERAIVRAVEVCAVKKHILEAPEFAVEVKRAE
ncbi:MAG: OsmC family protein [Planctomycetota bacterium]|jgi:ribosomal protein S12 methylthiotransferase accessory factor